MRLAQEGKSRITSRVTSCYFALLSFSHALHPVPPIVSASQAMPLAHAACSEETASPGPEAAWREPAWPPKKGTGSCPRDASSRYRPPTSQTSTLCVMDSPASLDSETPLSYRGVNLVGVFAREIIVGYKQREPTCDFTVCFCFSLCAKELITRPPPTAHSPCGLRLMVPSGSLLAASLSAPSASAVSSVPTGSLSS